MRLNSISILKLFNSFTANSIGKEHSSCDSIVVRIASLYFEGSIIVWNLIVIYVRVVKVVWLPNI